MIYNLLFSLQFPHTFTGEKIKYIIKRNVKNIIKKFQSK